MALYRFLLLCLVALCGPALAQVPLGNTPAVEQVVTANLDAYSISGLVTRMPDVTKFKYGIVQFPGYPSVMRMREENGSPVFELQGNSLVRGRKLWLDKETLVLTVDAPSDHWGNFDHLFRRSPRYGKDIGALLAAVAKIYPVADWTFVGHSEGAVSAYGAAVGNLEQAKRVVLISSVFVPTKNGPGISGLDWDMLAGRLLFVHHEEDPCQYTPYRSAKQYAVSTNSPLLTMQGGENRGDACRAYSYHGFPGLEAATFAAIQTWIKTGTVPATVSP
ncbi:MAG TPA: hypothetical protein VL381_09125 [Rhodocyclaceae bacterium]|nr:hypothetical protein [Rhodocyclaceae bacterium]